MIILTWDIMEAGYSRLFYDFPEANGQAGIIRTERGLTIEGTRITLYDVMDYVTAQIPS